jgi:signal peptide peptidase SppA
VHAAEKLTSRIPAIGEKIDHSPVVSVLKLHGVIAANRSPLSRGTLNLATLESAITKAFARDRLAAVALAINSPGGAATQSALIAERIRGLADEKGVEVLAFCEDVAASGGYWLACAADEIYAHATSLVGSIGVISSGFGLSGLIEKLGVERRLHTAGQNKARLDPFSPERSEDVAWLEEMQSELHDQFVDWVRTRRGGRLSTEPGVDHGGRDAGRASIAASEHRTEPGVDHGNRGSGLFTGEVWTGARAQRVGLVDGLGTLRSVVANRYPDARVSTAAPHRPLLARLGAGGGDAASWLSPQALFTAGMEAVETRAHWSRFGL